MLIINYNTRAKLNQPQNRRQRGEAVNHNVRYKVESPG